MTRPSFAVALVLAAVTVGCGPSVAQIRREMKEQEVREDQVDGAKGDKCVKGDCSELTLMCHTPNMVYRCTKQLKRIRATSPDAALSVYRPASINNYSVFLDLASWAGEETSPLTVGEAVCQYTMVPTWTTDDDPTNGEKEDLAGTRARACEALGTRTMKSPNADLTKVLGYKRQACELQREVDPEDECVLYHLFLGNDLKKGNPSLAASALRPLCDAAKPKPRDPGAAACRTLAEIMVESPSDRANAVELAKKAYTNDRDLTNTAIGIYSSLAKEAPGEARKLAEWLYTSKTASDVRGAEVWVMALAQGVGAPPDQAKSHAVAKELCESLARGSSNACYQHCANVPAGERDACMARAKQKQQADIEAMTHEISEASKASTARMNARLEAANKRRQAYQAAKAPPPAAAAPAENGGAKAGGKAGRTGKGWGMGMSRDLACADAKLKATSSAGCDDLTSAIGGAACDCSQMGVQWSCTTSVTCR